MSETERVKGKIKLVPFADKTLDELCEYICKIRGVSKPNDFYGGWIDQSQEELYDDYIIIDECLYCIIDKEYLQYEGFEFASKNEDGSINFFVQFYNGGACLSEVIEDAVKKL